MDDSDFREQVGKLNEINDYDSEPGPIDDYDSQSTLKPLKKSILDY